jgi:hypothetical protein
MRWEELFADLEGEFDAGKRAEQDAEIAEQTRAELAQITFASRLRAQVDARITLHVDGVGVVAGLLQRMGADFALLDTGTDAAGTDVAVSLGAITAAEALPFDARADAGVSRVASRLPLRSVLRGLAADRAYVVVRRRSGESDGGTLARIGADFVDLSVHEAGELPRSNAVRSTITIPTAAIAVVLRHSAPW